MAASGSVIAEITGYLARYRSAPVPIAMNQVRPELAIIIAPARS